MKTTDTKVRLDTRDIVTLEDLIVEFESNLKRALIVARERSCKDFGPAHNGSSHRDCLGTFRINCDSLARLLARMTGGIE